MCEITSVRLHRRQTLKAGLIFGALSPFFTRRAALADPRAFAHETEARWLAGLAPLPGVEPSAEWKTYAQAENERWQLSQPRVKAMQDWAAKEVAPLVPADHTLFYP